jgi:hypothetical protein
MVKADKCITYLTVLALIPSRDRVGVFGYRRKELCETKPNIYLFIYVFYAFLF